MVTLCRDWLHDLGEHSRCYHDVPPAERPYLPLGARLEQAADRALCVGG